MAGLGVGWPRKVLRAAFLEGAAGRNTRRERPSVMCIKCVVNAASVTNEAGLASIASVFVDYKIELECER